jgi:hypothetical protein
MAIHPVAAHQQMISGANSVFEHHGASILLALRRANESFVNGTNETSAEGGFSSDSIGPAGLIFGAMFIILFSVWFGQANIRPPLMS